MEHDTSRVAPASSVKCSIQVFKQRERLINWNAVYLECFENALNWELVEISITVAS
jgi:hypothetical protein